MEQHTQKRWHVEQRPGYQCVITAVVSEDGEVIADNEPYYPQPLHPDNATLIAAAPRLLAACRLILECDEYGPDPVVAKAISAATEAVALVY